MLNRESETPSGGVRSDSERFSTKRGIIRSCFKWAGDTVRRSISSPIRTVGCLIAKNLVKNVYKKKSFTLHIVTTAIHFSHHMIGHFSRPNLNSSHMTSSIWFFVFNLMLSQFIAQKFDSSPVFLPEKLAFIAFKNSNRRNIWGFYRFQKLSIR